MNLILVGKDVQYGVDGSGNDITAASDIHKLAEGSVIFGYSNDNVVLIDGTISGDGKRDENIYLWAKHNGEIQRTGGFLKDGFTYRVPNTTEAAARQEISLDMTLPTLSEGLHTGYKILNNDMPYYDAGREFSAEVYVDDDSVAADVYDAIAARLAECDWIESINHAAGAATLTFEVIDGTTVSTIGTGYLEGKNGNVTTRFKDGDAITYEEMVKYIEKVSGADGNYSFDMDGAPPLFTKDYGLNPGSTYALFKIIHYREQRYTSNDGSSVTKYNDSYFGYPDGQTPDPTGTITTTWADLFATLRG